MLMQRIFTSDSAGGGGKALAMAALGANVAAQYTDPRRMSDLEPRVMRAGVTIEIVSTDALPDSVLFDLVLGDAPCLGSGTWRRARATKWDLTPERLAELTMMQKISWRQPPRWSVRVDVWRMRLARL